MVLLRWFGLFVWLFYCVALMFVDCLFVVLSVGSCFNSVVIFVFAVLVVVLLCSGVACFVVVWVVFCSAWVFCFSLWFGVYNGSSFGCLC